MTHDVKTRHQRIEIIDQLIRKIIDRTFAKKLNKKKCCSIYWIKVRMRVFVGVQKIRIIIFLKTLAESSGCRVILRGRGLKRGLSLWGWIVENALGTCYIIFLSSLKLAQILNTDELLKETQKWTFGTFAVRTLIARYIRLMDIVEIEIFELSHAHSREFRPSRFVCLTVWIATGCYSSYAVRGVYKHHWGLTLSGIAIIRTRLLLAYFLFYLFFYLCQRELQKISYITCTQFDCRCHPLNFEYRTIFRRFYCVTLLLPTIG